MEESGLRVSDALALRNGNGNNGNNSDGFGNGGAWWVIILILFLGLGRNGWNNGGNGSNDSNGTNTVVIPTGAFNGFGSGYGPCCTPATAQGVTDAFNFNQLDNGIRGIERGLCDGFYTTNLGVTNLGTQMLQGFCSSDRANLQSFNGIQSSLCQGFNGLQSAIAQTNYNMKDCCCETDKAIMQTNFNNQANANAISNQLASCCCDIENGQQGIRAALDRAVCDITVNQDKQADRIINHLVQSEMQSLRTDLQSAQFQLSQNAQTNNIINQLLPTPRPAYVVSSPYQSYAYNTASAYGCNNGCGC